MAASGWHGHQSHQSSQELRPVEHNIVRPLYLVTRPVVGGGEPLQDLLMQRIELPAKAVP
jgi:hypothetical protein